MATHSTQAQYINSSSPLSPLPVELDKVLGSSGRGGIDAVRSNTHDTETR
eukprot:m.294317 g.294317  ORF g.294317 m.294317 type:complete len:50 (-) comp42163_c0_seq1:147-296(-)